MQIFRAGLTWIGHESLKFLGRVLVDSRCGATQIWVMSRLRVRTGGF